MLLLLIIVLAVLLVLGVAYARKQAHKSRSSKSCKSCKSSSARTLAPNFVATIAAAEPAALSTTTMAHLWRHAGAVAQQAYIILFKEQVGDADRATSMICQESVGMILCHRYNSVLRGFAAKNVSTQLLEYLRHHPAVASLHEDAIITLPPHPVPPAIAPRSTQIVPWGPKRVGGPSSSFRVGGNPYATGVNVDVFIIDTGVQLDHPDLHVISPGISFVSGTGENSANDKNGHGTHVAGIVGAIDNLYGVVGVCPGAKINPVRVLDANGSGQFSWVIAGINYVHQLKTANPSRLMVANLSLGVDVGTHRYNVLDTAVSNCIAAGVPFAVAAGNSSSEAAHFSPAHVTTATCVGAMTSANTFASSYSNFGPTVSILAPGSEILSTYLKSSYATLSGTSMAAPVVAGIMADYLVKNPAKTSAQIKSALITSATNSSPVNPLVKGSPSNTPNRCIWMGNL